jgi:hypothetical protein
VSVFISGTSAAPTFAQVNAALATADADLDINGQAIVDQATPVPATPGGTLIASLSGNVAFAATETKTVHTITPTNGQATTYRIHWRAVPATNDGTGAPLIQETIVLVRKTGGTVTVSGTGTPVQVRNSPLSSAAGAASASTGNLLVTFATSGGAATLTQCDVYADAST